MTSIRALSSVAPPPLSTVVRPDGVGSGASAASLPGGASFPAALKTASAPPSPSPSSSPGPAATPAEPEPGSNVLYESHIKAMIQQFLACRKMSFHAAGKTHRPGAAGGLLDSDCDDVAKDDPSADDACARTDAHGVQLECGMPPPPMPLILPLILPLSFAHWRPETTGTTSPSIVTRSRRRARPRSADPRLRLPHAGDVDPDGQD